MIIKGPHNNIRYTRLGKTNGSCKLASPIIEVKCDKCNKVFIERCDVFDKRKKHINKEYCGQCAIPLLCSYAGYRGTHNEDGTVKLNKGNFSTERVKAMTEEEYSHFCETRKIGSRAFHDKINSDPVLKEAHYKKVFKNSKIGYVSKAQKDIYEILKDDGFELEQYIKEVGITVDMVNFKTKTVIEYNGDFWHANPRLYQPDDYMEVLKMTAKEKWTKDRKRRFALRNCGFEVMVIWENEWKNDRERVFKKLKVLKDDNWIIPKWHEIGEVVKSKKMKNIELDKNKYVPLKEVDKYLKDGWEYGHISRKIS